MPRNKYKPYDMTIWKRKQRTTAPRRGGKWIVAAVAGLAALTVAAPAGAQTNGSNSPYSRYGFGLLGDRAQGFNKGMAGLSYGMRNGTEVNSKNPASYSAIDSLSFLFDMGFSLQNANLEQAGRKINAHNSSYDYLTMGFRASKNLGVSIGMLPFSTIGYSLGQSFATKENPEVTQTDTYSGDGGLHEVYVGMGWKPLKFASVGFNVGYLWGDMTHTVLASFSDNTIASRRRQYAADIRTYKADFGVQFEGNLGKNHSYVLGLTYGLGHGINSDGHYYDQKVESGTAIGDTITAHNPYGLPHTFGVGLTWSYKNSLRVGADYNLQKWADVKSPMVVTGGAAGGQSYVGRKGGFSDMHKLTVGAEYVPDPDGLHWRDRVRYRAGFSYTTPYTRVNGQDGPRDFLVSLGVGLPIINYHNNRSLLNVSAQYERVKPKVAGMITENYLRLCIGLSFNERWFMKWKVE